MNYQLLAPRHRSLFGYAELHAGDDHLLELRSIRVMEEYKRFRYEDICAIQVSKTAEVANWALAISVLSVMTMAAIYLIPNWWARAILWTPPLITLAYGVYVILQGPRCLSRLVTKSGTVELKSLRTLRAAQIALPQLQARIAAVQPIAWDVSMEAPPPSWTDPRKAMYKKMSGFWITIAGTALSHVFFTALERYPVPKRSFDLWSAGLFLGITALAVTFILWRRISKSMQDQGGLLWAGILWPLLLVEVVTHTGMLIWRLVEWTASLNTQGIQQAPARLALARYEDYLIAQVAIYIVIAVVSATEYFRARNREQLPEYQAQ